MAPDNFLYSFCSLGIGVCVCSALTPLMSHGRRYPYNWFECILLYWAFTFFCHYPFVRDWCEGTPLDDLPRIAGFLLMPLALTAFTRLSCAVRRLSFWTLFFTWAPFLLLIVLTRVTSLVWVHYIGSALIIAGVVWWCYCVCIRINDYSQTLKRYVSDISYLDFRWMRVSVVSVALLVIFYHCMGVFLPTVLAWQYVFEVFVLIPLFILFENQCERHHYFEGFDDLAEPNSNISDNLYAMKSQLMERRRQNRELRHAHAVVERFYRQKETGVRATLPQYVSSAESDRRIEQELAVLEKKGLFFIDQHLSLDSLAQRLDTDRQSLNGYFTRKNIVFYDYIERLRVNHAAMLLRKAQDVPDENVAFRCGFGSVNAFREAFEHRFHKTPAEYRATHRDR